MASFAEIKREKQGRLHDLEMKQARYGINASPEVNMEVEDLRRWMGHAADIEQQLSLLNINRRNLTLYLRQLGLHSTANVPPHIINGIREARTHIANIKASLLKYYKVTVDDEPNDFEQEEPSTPSNVVGLGPSSVIGLKEDLAEVYRLLVELNDVPEAVRLLQVIRRRLP